MRNKTTPPEQVTASRDEIREMLVHTNRVRTLPRVDIGDCRALAARVDEYFQLCAEDGTRPGMIELCLAMGVSRRLLRDWALDPNAGEFHEMAVNAEMLLESFTEQLMQNGKINPVSGIFLLKNHYPADFKDKQEIEVKPQNPLGELLPPSELMKRYLEDIPVEVNIEDAELQ